MNAKYWFCVVFLCVIFLFLPGCQEICYSESDQYYEYIQNRDNGLRKEGKLNDYEIELSYQPAELRILESQILNIVSLNLDSLVDEYRKSMLFVLVIKAQNGQSLKYYGSKSEEEFHYRQEVFTYRMSEFVKLSCDQMSIHSQVCQLEQSFGVGGYLKYQILFVADDYDELRILMNSKVIEFEIEDPFLQDDIIRFDFKRSDIQMIPRLVGNTSVIDNI